MLKNNRSDGNYIEGGPCFTLTAAMGMGGGHVPMVVYTTNGIRTNNAIEHHDVCPTVLASFNKMGDALPLFVYHSNHRGTPPKEHQKCPTLMAWMGTGGNNIPMFIEYPKVYWLKTLRTGGQCELSISPTLTSGAGMGDTLPVTIDSREYYYYNQTNANCTGPDETAGTLLARYGTGGGNVPFVLENRVKDEEKMNTFVQQRYDQHKEDTVSTTLVATGGILGGGSETLVTKEKKNVPTSKVRRLTPIECERLQGFPDNWTQIEWRGKTKEECPLSPRYKAIGNSMAVPVMRWLAEGILIAEGKEVPDNNPWKAKKKSF